MQKGDQLIVFFDGESWTFIGFAIMHWNGILFNSIGNRPFIFQLDIFPM